MQDVSGSQERRCIAGLGILSVTVLLLAGMAGCVPADYHFASPNTEGSNVASPGKGTSTYVELTFPDPNFGDTVRGPVSSETGSIFPSDLQRHNFFSGTT